jgi:hypothetical protein
VILRAYGNKQIQGGIMKKLTLGLALLLSGLAANASAAYPAGTSRCEVTVPSYSGGFTFGLTGLYWRATPPRDFGTTFSHDIDLFDFDPLTALIDPATFNHHNTDNDYDWGFKANVGYIFPCSGNDVNLRYTHFDRNEDGGSDGFAIPSLATLDILLDPLFGPSFNVEIDPSSTTIVVLPVFEIVNQEGFERTDFSSTLSVKSDFKNNTWDLDFGQANNVDCNFNFRLFGGLRYSKLEHQLDTINDLHLSGSIASDVHADIIFSNVTLGVLEAPAGTFEGATTIGTIQLLYPVPNVTSMTLDVSVGDSLNRESQFEGVGPRIGIDLNYNFCGGFGLVGSVSTALLVGDVDNTSFQNTVASGSVDFDGLSLVRIQLPEVSNVMGFNATVNDPNFSKEVSIDFKHPEETRVVANIDAKLGLGYTYQFCNCSRSRLTVEAGYQVSHYFNAIDRLTIGDIFDTGLSDQRSAENISFDGPYVSVQVAI